MRRPFALALGLILLTAAVGCFVGPLYVESAESCGTLLQREDLAANCDTYAQRRWTVLIVLLAMALPLLLTPFFRSTLAAEREHSRANVSAGAVSGLLALPIAAALMVPLAMLDVLQNGTSQAYTGLPYVFAPAVLAVGCLISAWLAVRAGADEGVALAAAAVGLPLLHGVQAAVEAFRWPLRDTSTPLLLSAPFSDNNQVGEAATLVTLALSAVPLALAMGLAARSRRRMSAELGAGLLGLAALVATVLFETTDSGIYATASIRWLPVVLLPAGLALLAIFRRSRSASAPADHVLADV